MVLFNSGVSRNISFHVALRAGAFRGARGRPRRGPPGRRARDGAGPGGSLGPQSCNNLFSLVSKESLPSPPGGGEGPGPGRASPRGRINNVHAYWCCSAYVAFVCSFPRGALPTQPQPDGRLRGCCVLGVHDPACVGGSPCAGARAGSRRQGGRARGRGGELGTVLLRCPQPRRPGRSSSAGGGAGAATRPRCYVCRGAWPKLNS